MDTNTLKAMGGIEKNYNGRPHIFFTGKAVEELDASSSSYKIFNQQDWHCLNILMNGSDNGVTKFYYDPIKQEFEFEYVTQTVFYALVRSIEKRYHQQ